MLVFASRSMVRCTRSSRRPRSRARRRFQRGVHRHEIIHARDLQAVARNNGTRLRPHRKARSANSRILRSMVRLSRSVPRITVKPSALSAAAMSCASFLGLGAPARSCKRYCR